LRYINFLFYSILFYNIKHTTRTKLGKRAFSYADPAAWNALPASLHDITDISKFKKSFTTVLFERAFPAA